MKLEKVIKGCAVTEVRGSLDVGITAVCNDSRKVVPGSLFIAVKGHGSDGHAYIGKAVEAGAAAIIYETEGCFGEYGNVTFVRVADSRLAVALAADNFYDHPSGKLNLIGITGTNGKTTTVTLLYHLFMAQGYNCGLLSTIANYVGTRRTETTNTTSDPVTINSLLSEMADAGCGYCFMEVSSIGIEQDRVAGLEFKEGIFSNLTHEYLRCKKQFFDNLPASAKAITNIDDRNGEVMVQNTKAKVVTYSCKTIADHTCRIIEQSFEGMLLRIDGREAWTRLIGEHNAYNILAIYSAAVEAGADPEETLVAISKLESAPGRLEVLRGPRNLSVIIDYAHTPDALENVLRTLKGIDAGTHLTCLFGCGGDRDKTKRPEMAKVAEDYSDRIVVTSDNSRSERTEDIMDDIRKGFSQKGLAKAIFIADRKEAIRTSIMLAPAGSIILLAGKGHETYQIIGNEHRHFDEREIASEVFANIETTE